MTTRIAALVESVQTRIYPEYVQYVMILYSQVCLRFADYTLIIYYTHKGKCVNLLTLSSSLSNPQSLSNTHTVWPHGMLPIEARSPVHRLSIRQSVHRGIERVSVYVFSYVRVERA